MLELLAAAVCQDHQLVEHPAGDIPLVIERQLDVLPEYVPLGIRGEQRRLPVGRRDPVTRHIEAEPGLLAVARTLLDQNPSRAG
jgi:hypothetical protein